MRVISFANPKGGSGKTTSAMLLAEQIALSGGRTAVLDLDPNANILRWAHDRRQAGRSLPFGVYARPPADETVDLIDSLRDKADYLLIDLEGSKDQIVTFALSRTDLCLIPLDGSPMEARQAAQTLRLVESTARMIRAPIAAALLFTRANAAFQSADERDVRREIGESEARALPARIARRAAYTRLFRDGLLLSDMAEAAQRELEAKGGAGAQKALQQILLAIDNARAYAAAVIGRLKEIKAS